MLLRRTVPALLALLAITLTSTAEARLTGAQEREMMITILGVIPDVVEEHGEDMGRFYCFAMYYKAVQLPRIPPDVQSAYNEASGCVALLDKMPTDASLIKPALERYGDAIEDMRRAMNVPPVGDPYQPGREHHEMIIAAVHSERASIDLGTAFVKALPQPKALAEAQLDGETSRLLTLRLRDLWVIAVGPVFASTMQQERVIPYLVKRIDELAASIDRDSHVSIELRMGEIEEQLRLLKVAEPEHETVKKTEALIEELRTAYDRAYEKLVAQTRMPQDNFKGGDRAQILAQVKRVLEDNGYGVERIVIPSSEWPEPVTQGWWTEEGRFYWTTWQRLPGSAAIDSKQEGIERYRVMPWTLVKQWDPSKRAFGPPRVVLGGWGNVILKENIDK